MNQLNTTQVRWRDHRGHLVEIPATALLGFQLSPTGALLAIRGDGVPMAEPVLLCPVRPVDAERLTRLVKGAPAETTLIEPVYVANQLPDVPNDAQVNLSHPAAMMRWMQENPAQAQKGV
jgi:hypothetical protein